MPGPIEQAGGFAGDQPPLVLRGRFPMRFHLGAVLSQKLLDFDVAAGGNREAQPISRSL